MTHPLINQHLQYNFMPVAGLYRRRDLFLNDPLMSTEHLFSIWTTGWNFIHTICGRDLYFSGIYQKYNFNSKFIKSENFYIKNSEETISLNWCPPKDFHWSNLSIWSMTSVTSFWTTSFFSLIEYWLSSTDWVKIHCQVI